MTTRLFTALLVLAVIATGCTNSPRTATKTATRDSMETAKPENALALRFAACMRANGVEDFPDPDASGDLTIDAIANGSSVDVNSSQFDQATTACKDLEPAGFTGQKRTPEQQAAALEFAQCVRENGVPDFPDPDVDSPIIDTNRIPSTGTADGMPLLHAAMRRCRSLGARMGVRSP